MHKPPCYGLVAEGKRLKAEDHTQGLYPSLTSGFSAGKHVGDGSSGQGDLHIGHRAPLLMASWTDSSDPAHLHTGLLIAWTSLIVALWTCSDLNQMLSCSRQTSPQHGFIEVAQCKSCRICLDPLRCKFNPPVKPWQNLSFRATKCRCKAFWCWKLGILGTHSLYRGLLLNFFITVFHEEPFTDSLPLIARWLVFYFFLISDIHT